MKFYSLLLGCILFCPTVVTAENTSCLLAIDIGHDRQSVGARSARGKSEWSFNVQLAKLLYDAAVSRHIQAILINPTGSRIRLLDRPRIAQEAKASLIVSIHHDSAQPQYLLPWEWSGTPHLYSDKFRGYGLFVSGKNVYLEESIKVASDIANGLLNNGNYPSLHHAEPIRGENRPLLDALRGIYQFDDLVVLKNADMPAILLEAGIIINRDQELEVSDPDFQHKVVDVIVTATKLHCQRLDSR